MNKLKAYNKYLLSSFYILLTNWMKVPYSKNKKSDQVASNVSNEIQHYCFLSH